MPRENFESFALSWCEKVLPAWKPSSAVTAKNHLTLYLIPRFGKMTLSQIKTEDIQGLVSKLVSQGKSRGYVMNIVVTLASVLRAANRWGYKSQKVDYEALVFPVEGERQKGRTYSNEQVKTILGEAGEPDRTIFALAAMTGMRAGEISALAWEDVNFTAGVIEVRRSCYRGVMTSVKSKAGNRTIPMPDALVSILTAHAEQTGGMAGLVFKNSNGQPVNMGDFAYRRLRPLLDRLKIPRAAWHAFRHAQATALVSTGANPKIAQAQLGHSDIRVTLGLYTHLVGVEHRNAVSRAAEMFLPDGKKQD